MLRVFKVLFTLMREVFKLCRGGVTQVKFWYIGLPAPQTGHYMGLEFAFLSCALPGSQKPPPISERSAIDSGLESVTYPAMPEELFSKLCSGWRLAVV